MARPSGVGASTTTVDLLGHKRDGCRAGAAAWESIRARYILVSARIRSLASARVVCDRRLISTAALTRARSLAVKARSSDPVRAQIALAAIRRLTALSAEIGEPETSNAPVRDGRPHTPESARRPRRRPSQRGEDPRRDFTSLRTRRGGSGLNHAHAVRVLARAWLRIIWRCRHDHNPYDQARHVAAVAARHPQTANPEPTPMAS